MTGVPVKKNTVRRCGERTHACGVAMDDRSDAFRSQEPQSFLVNNEKREGKGRLTTGFSGTLEFGLPTFRTARQHISIVVSHPACDTS